MEIFLWLLSGALTLTVIALCIRLYTVLKAADEISRSLESRLSDETNVLIDVPCRNKHMRAVAKNLNSQLSRLNDERHRFFQGDNELKTAVTNISHDLRTPLTAICGYLDLLRDEEKSENASRYVNMIVLRTEALKKLTEELFAYSVISSVKDEPTEEVNLNSLLEESIASLYAAFKQRNITPVISIPESSVVRTLPRTSVSRVFENVLSNALKYSDGDLEITLTEKGEITFANSAAALTSVETGKLFDRFFTVETGRNSTGLGLSIAKLLCLRMGGSIAAEFNNGKLYITVSFLR